MGTDRLRWICLYFAQSLRAYGHIQNSAMFKTDIYFVERAENKSGSGGRGRRTTGHIRAEAPESAEFPVLVSAPQPLPAAGSEEWDSTGAPNEQPALHSNSQMPARRH